MQDLVFTFPIAGVSLNLMVLLALGFGVGILSGLFGVGGGFLLTPALFFLGVPPVVAVGTQSVQVLAASVSGFWSHLKRGNVDLKMGLYLTLGGLLGSSFGVQLLALLRVLGQADDFIRLTYVLFLGFIGTIMLRESLSAVWPGLRRRNRPQRRTLHVPFLHGLPLRTRFPKSKLYMSRLAPVAVGFVVGILTAVMGVGGGFIMVPAMIYLLGMPTLIVIGTSLFQIIFVMISLTIQQTFFNQAVDLLLGFILLLGGVMGAQIGVRLAGRLPAARLRIVLAILVLLVAAKLTFDLVIPPRFVFSLTPDEALHETEIAG